MSDDPWFHITIAASNLKVTAPEQFEALVRAVQLLAEKENKTFLAAEGEQLPRAQGRTNLAIQLRERLVNCFEQRKNYENRA